MKDIICFFLGHKPVNFYETGAGGCPAVAIYTREEYLTISKNSKCKLRKQIKCDRCGKQIGGIWWFDDEQRYKDSLTYNFHKTNFYKFFNKLIIKKDIYQEKINVVKKDGNSIVENKPF